MTDRLHANPRAGRLARDHDLLAAPDIGAIILCESVVRAKSKRAVPTDRRFFGRSYLILTFIRVGPVVPEIRINRGISGKFDRGKLAIATLKDQNQGEQFGDREGIRSGATAARHPGAVAHSQWRRTP